LRVVETNESLGDEVPQDVAVRGGLQSTVLAGEGQHHIPVRHAEQPGELAADCDVVSGAEMLAPGEP
jgi:hypothetical protein